MKISKITTNADIYTSRPHFKQNLAAKARPLKVLEALHVYKYGTMYCVLMYDKEGLFVNQINTLRLMLLVNKLSGASACLCEKTINAYNFQEFDINKYALL